jgi:radical SAM protein
MPRSNLCHSEPVALICRIQDRTQALRILHYDIPRVHFQQFFGLQSHQVPGDQFARTVRTAGICNPDCERLGNGAVFSRKAPRSTRGAVTRKFEQNATLVTARNVVMHFHRTMNPQINAIDFNERPFIAIWEVTQACDLACVHCRASAQPDRHPMELSTDEGKHLIDQIAALKVPVFVLTGGDPIKRPDLFELIGHARSTGVRVSLTPSATPLLTRDIIVRLKEAGLARLAVSMDGARAETHDAFRGMAGSFARTLDAVRWANEIGLPVQINTTFSRRNIAEIDDLVALMEGLRITLWSVFFLVPTGRGQLNDLLNAEEFEQVFAKIHSLSKTARFDIKTTEAQHYRRFLLQQRVSERKADTGDFATREKTSDAIGRAPRGLNDGKGFVFISHTGEVFPSGFLPISAGNIRQQPLDIIYRESPLFRSLRDTSKLEGKCGACEFKQICGGSRARAYALTGNPNAEEPCCIHFPKGYIQPPPSQRRASNLHVLQGA